MFRGPKNFQRKMFLFAFLASGIFFAAFACGPVNGLKANDASALKLSGLNGISTPQDSINFSTNHQFVVKMTLLGSKADASDDPASALKTNTPTAASTGAASVDSGPGTDSTPSTDASGDSGTHSDSSPKPKVGDNQFRVNIAHGSDLSGGSDQMIVTLQFEHSSGKIVKLFPAAITKQTDGSYLTTLTFRQKGTWKVHFHMTDKELNDEAVVEIDI